LVSLPLIIEQQGVALGSSSVQVQPGLGSMPLALPLVLRQEPEQPGLVQLAQQRQERVLLVRLAAHKRR
jgi:hypothetical protein